MEFSCQKPFVVLFDFERLCANRKCLSFGFGKIEIEFDYKPTKSFLRFTGDWKHSDKRKIDVTYISIY